MTIIAAPIKEVAEGIKRHFLSFSVRIIAQQIQVLLKHFLSAVKLAFGHGGLREIVTGAIGEVRRIADAC